MDTQKDHISYLCYHAMYVCMYVFYLDLVSLAFVNEKYRVMNESYVQICITILSEWVAKEIIMIQWEVIGQDDTNRC